VTARGRACPRLCSLSVPLAQETERSLNIPFAYDLGVFLAAMLIACVVPIAGFLIIQRSFLRGSWLIGALKG
jgi:ABC-type glycerol-3-phosphate transport system permease component